MDKTNSDSEGNARPHSDPSALNETDLAAGEPKAPIQTLITVVGLSLIVSIALFLITNQILLALTGGVGSALAWVSFVHPYSALWLLIIYMPFAGTVSYWAEWGNPLLQFGQDILAIPAMIAILWNLKKNGMPLIIPQNIQIPLLTVLIFALATLFTVNLPLDLASAALGSPSDSIAQPPPTGDFFLMGILGLKVLLVYLPLITCTYYMIQNEKTFWTFTRLHIILAITCCSLGLMQYVMLRAGVCQGTDHLTDNAVLAASLDAKCLVGGSLIYSPSQNLIRLPGTFAAPWQWGWFLIANTFFAVASAIKDCSPVWRLISFLALALLVANAVVSGQSAALFVMLVFIMVMLALTGKLVPPTRWASMIGALALLSIMSWVLFPEMIQAQFNEIIEGWLASAPTSFMIEQASSQDITILGHGLGRATNAARILGETRLIESYYPKLMYEIGILGVAAFLALVTTLTVVTFKIWRSLENKTWRSYAACFWLFILLISYPPYHYPLDAAPVAIYYWMILGLVLRLPNLEQQLEQQAPEKRLSQDLGQDNEGHQVA